MINALIKWSIANRVLVILVSLMLAGAGIFAVKQTPVDAIPDLSDVQVIIKTSYPGQAADVIEQQVTYPLANAMLAVPKRNLYVVFHILATLIFTSSLTTTQICTGQEVEY